MESFFQPTGDRDGGGVTGQQMGEVEGGTRGRELTVMVLLGRLGWGVELLLL